MSYLINGNVEKLIILVNTLTVNFSRDVHEDVHH